MGLLLQSDGDLLLVDYANGSPDLLDTLLFPGSGVFDPGTPHAIAFTVSTTTGRITDISYDGETLSLSGTDSLFLEANTARVGVLVSFVDDSIGDGSGLIDDFQIIAAVPEPTTITLAALALVGCAFRWRRQR